MYGQLRRRSAFVVASVLAVWAIGLGGLGSVGSATSQTAKTAQFGATSARSDWRAFLHDPGHSSHNASATAITAANAASLHLVYRWVPDPPTMPGQSNGSLTASPTVVNHHIYIGANTGVFYALNDSTGAVIWKRFLGFQPRIGCPAVGFTSTATVLPDPVTGRLTVYVAAPDGYLYALSAATGATVWRSAVAIPSTTVNDYLNWSSPAVANGKIYVGVSSNCDNPLSTGAGEKAYNQATGALLGTYHTLPAGTPGGSVWSSAAVTPEGDVIVSTGNASGGKLIGDAQSIVRLNGTTLARLDGYQIPVVAKDADFGGSPTVFNAVIGGINTEMVGACNKDGRYYAFNAHHIAAGPVWSRLVGSTYNATTDSQCDGAAIWDGSRLFVPSNDTTIAGTNYHGSIRQLNPATGAVIWQTGLAGIVIGSPTLNGSAVIGVPTFDTEGGAKNAYLINAASGAILTNVNTLGAKQFAQPVFADNLLLVATWGKGLFAYAAP